MTRRILNRPRPMCLSATCTRDEDIELIKTFKEVCASQGFSVQAGILQACRNYLSDLGVGQ